MMIVDNQAFTSYTPQIPQNSPFIATVTTKTKNESAAETTQPSPESESEPVKQIVADWKTPEEARQAFESLLSEVITSPSTSWRDAVPQLTKDIRFTVCYDVSMLIRLLKRKVSVSRSSVSLSRRW